MNIHVRHPSCRYSDEEIDRIAGWLREGLSGSQIAANLSQLRGAEVTRNQAIGVIHRNKALKAIGFKRQSGWSHGRPKSTTPRQERPKRSPRASPGYIPQRQFMDELNQMPEPSISPIDYRIASYKPRARDLGDPEAYDRDSRRILLEDLTSTTCKWPVNDGGPFLFCGVSKAFDEKQPYCAHHAQRAVQCR